MEIWLLPPNVCGNVSLCNFFGEQTKNHMPLEMASVLLEIYAIEIFSCRHNNTFTGMFTETFLLILKHLKQSKCASAGKWLTILWYIHSMG